MAVVQRQEILGKLRGLIKEATHGRVSVEAISLEANLRDLGVKSMDMVELALLVEDAFKIMVPDEKAEGLRTVEDVVRMVEDLCHQS